MDIISHSLTGVAVGTVFSSFSKGTWKEKTFITLIGGLGGALPDLDAISLWSKFDETIGVFLNLKHSGSDIYFGKFWYSHHGALHSLLAPLLIILIPLLWHSIKKKSYSLVKVNEHLGRRMYYLLSFFLGFICHLLEDMPTPASVWGGINLFFPFSDYYGGFGKIWWWNNYDLVLIICSVIVLNLIISSLPSKYHLSKSIACTSVFVLGVFMFLFQINNRPVDFSYSGHTSRFGEFEAQSKAIQKNILSEDLYELMSELDRSIPLNF